jgi:hypothetical protein
MGARRYINTCAASQAQSRISRLVCFSPVGNGKSRMTVEVAGVDGLSDEK